MQLEERLARLERLLEALATRPIQIHETLPKTNIASRVVGCTQAELYVILDIIEEEVFKQSKSIEEAYEKWQEIIVKLREYSVRAVRTHLGI